jgi:hypothetical protein
MGPLLIVELGQPFGLALVLVLHNAGLEVLLDTFEQQLLVRPNLC